MTKREELFYALGEIDDRFILRSGAVVKKKKILKNSAWMYGGMLASAACLLLVINAFGGVGLHGDVTPPPVESSASIGGNGPDHPSDYVPGDTSWLEEDLQEQAYGMATELEWVDFNAGPVMPITFAEENTQITASRELTYDFAAVDKGDKGLVPVKDAYVLHNTSDMEQTVTFYYPYVSDVSELSVRMPKIYVDGQLKETNVSGGAYWGMDSSGLARMFGPNVSTDEYSYMIGDIEPMELATADEVLNQTVTVYEFYDFDAGSVPGEGTMYSARFKVADPNKVFMSDMYDMTYDGEYVTVSFALSQVKDLKPAIYFMDGEPAEYEEQGYCYIDMWEENKSDEVTSDMKKYETTMKAVLENRIEEKMQSATQENTDDAKLKNLYYERAARMFVDMYRWNTDGEVTAEDEVFYAACISDIVNTIWEYESLFVLSDTVTIPAGESLTLDLEYVKQGACQTYEPQESLRDNYCYDNMPNLGTNVKFISQRAAVEENGNIRIEDQNYGFDLESAVKSVELELDAERYYVIVKILK